MIFFFLGLIIFFGAHILTAFARGLRAGVVKAIGEAGYKGLYSIVSTIGLGLIIFGWPAAGAAWPHPLFVPNFAVVPVAFVLMFCALTLLAAAYLPAGRIAAAARHPMLAGVKIWAFAHLLVNGEVRALVLFGAFLAFGVLDRIAVKKRGAPTRAAGPLLNDLLAILVGAGAWVAIFLFLHRHIAGVDLPWSAEARAALLGR